MRREEAHGGNNAWYPMPDNARYPMPDDRWYIRGRLLTGMDRQTVKPFPVNGFIRAHEERYPPASMALLETEQAG